MVRLVNNIHKKDTCCNEVGLCVQSVYIILGLVVNMTGKVHIII